MKRSKAHYAGTKGQRLHDFTYLRGIYIGNFIETEIRIDYQDWGKGEMESRCLMGTEFQFGKMRTFWRWMGVMAAQQCEMYLMPRFLFVSCFVFVGRGFREIKKLCPFCACPELWGKKTARRAQAVNFSTVKLQWISRGQARTTCHVPEPRWAGNGRRWSQKASYHIFEFCTEEAEIQQMFTSMFCMFHLRGSTAFFKKVCWHSSNVIAWLVI